MGKKRRWNNLPITGRAKKTKDQTADQDYMFDDLLYCVAVINGCLSQIDSQPLKADVNGYYHVARA